VLDNGEGRAPLERPGPAPTTTATMLPDQADQHCLRCSCRCRCYRPPPEPPYIVAPPRPGEPFYSAYLAELRVV
jgi:hypothetical protein